MNRRDALRLTFTFPVLKRSIWVGVIVGTMLNLINQGDALVAAADLVVWKIVLTYFVPFCVASYGSYSALCAFQRQ